MSTASELPITVLLNFPVDAGLMSHDAIQRLSLQQLLILEYKTRERVNLYPTGRLLEANGRIRNMTPTRHRNGRFSLKMLSTCLVCT